MIKLGVNIDHVATLRQARLGTFPDPLQAARIAKQAGADGITVHLREDRRHIQDRDVTGIKKAVKIKLNLEMSLAPAIVQFACKVKPHDVCLVPEKREELTTEGGLDVLSQQARVTNAVKRLKEAGISVSLFIDPSAGQIQAAKAAGADTVELHTGTYANASGAAQNRELVKLIRAAEAARKLGLTLNAGHGLDYDNVRPVAGIKGMNELNIGFSIIARSVFVGLPQAVKEMKALIRR